LLQIICNLLIYNFNYFFVDLCLLCPVFQISFSRWRSIVFNANVQNYCRAQLFEIVSQLFDLNTHPLINTYKKCKLFESNSFKCTFKKMLIYNMFTKQVNDKRKTNTICIHSQLSLCLSRANQFWLTPSF
jgi:hypothetical protein